MSKEFTCFGCHRTFVSNWSDEEAKVEAKIDFGDFNDPVILCDDCYQLVKPSEHPEELEEWRRNKENE